MIDPALKRNRRRKEDGRGQTGQEIDQRGCALGGQVFCDFQTQGQIVATVQLKGLSEVDRHEAVLRDVEQRAIDVLAIEAEDGGSVFRERREPGTGAAADVHDARGIEQVDDQRHDFARRIAHLRVHLFEKPPRVRFHGRPEH